MKSQAWKWTSIVFLLLSSLLVEKSFAHSRVNISVFYSALAPYGEWIDYGGYGLSWRPTVVAVGWRPYTHGRWILTDYGWTWVSLYEWGWAPFHYGRWVYDNFYGWIWVPDNVWGPAWVQWHYSDAYIGWAALPPAAKFRLHIGISIGNYSVPHFGWSFTHCNKFIGERVVVLPIRENKTLLRKTRFVHGITVRNQKIYNRGPRVDFVERVSRTPVRKAAIVENRNFGATRGDRIEGDRLHIYRPDLDRANKEKSEPKRIPDSTEGQEGERRARMKTRESRESSLDSKHESREKERAAQDIRERNRWSR